MPRTLNIIGCGNLGKALGRLWCLHGVFEVQDVLTRSTASAEMATTFIGAGRAVERYADLRRADITMIATPDDQIANACSALVDAGLISPESVIFHCSGAMRSADLQSALQLGAAVASIHPIRSFAVPEQVARDFAGTFCGSEGDPRAVSLLNPAFSALGAKIVPINAEFKVLYHAAAVFASNYLVTLLDVAVQAYAKSGIGQDVALELIEPLVRATVDNIFRIGPAAALSGPIARGDMATVARQHDAVAAWDKRHGELYRQFAELTVDLAARRDLKK